MNPLGSRGLHRENRRETHERAFAYEAKTERCTAAALTQPCTYIKLVDIHTHIHIHTYTHTYIHTCMHGYVHIDPISDRQALGVGASSAPEGDPR